MNPWSNLYVPVLFLYVGCLFMGIRDLRKLKAEIEEKFSEVDQKTLDSIDGFYLAVYMLLFVHAIPVFFDSSFGTLRHILKVITGVLVGVWAAGLSTPYYNYLTLSQEKTSIFWKLPVVTLAMAWILECNRTVGEWSAISFVYFCFYVGICDKDFVA